MHKILYLLSIMLLLHGINTLSTQPELKKYVEGAKEEKRAEQMLVAVAQQNKEMIGLKKQVYKELRTLYHDAETYHISRMRDDQVYINLKKKREQALQEIYSHADLNDKSLQDFIQKDIDKPMASEEYIGASCCCVIQ